MTLAVLLATYNGANYLSQQLQSIMGQILTELDESQDLKIYISDDGSKDATLDIIARISALSKKDTLHVRQGPQNGFAANFISLLTAPDIIADYIALADQDDIWDANKMCRAINQLKKIPSDRPALYCSRSRLINRKGEEIGLSPLYKKKPSFHNALVQCIAGGNTMVLNKSAHELIKKAADISVSYHDWWVYLLLTGAGGLVLYDEYPSIAYRQHDNNVLGRNNTLLAKSRRLKDLYKGKFRHWNDLNCAAILRYTYLLTPSNQQVLRNFAVARQQWFLPRIWGLWRSGVYRQGFLDNMGLFLAAVFKKL